jgi:hypothetical protein
MLIAPDVAEQPHAGDNQQSVHREPDCVHQHSVPVIIIFILATLVFGEVRNHRIRLRISNRRTVWPVATLFTIERTVPRPETHDPSVIVDRMRAILCHGRRQKQTRAPLW